MPREYYSVAHTGETESLRREVNRILDSISRRLNSMSQDGENISLGGRKFTDLAVGADNADAIRLDQGFLLDDLAITLLGTANEITVTDNLDETLTFSLPGHIKLDSATASRLLATDAGKLTASVSDLTNWIAGTANRLAVTNDGDGTVTLDVNESGIDHGGFAGLGDDDHPGYLWGLGRTGDQTLIGSIDSGGSLTLQSTSHATKGLIKFGAAGNSVYDENTGFWGIGTGSPGYELDIVGDTKISGFLGVGTNPNPLATIDASQTFTDPGASAYQGLKFQSIFSADSANITTIQRGIFGAAYYDGTFDMSGGLRAGDFSAYARPTATGTLASANGMVAAAGNLSDVATITYVRGIQSIQFSTGTGDITYFIGVDFNWDGTNIVTSSKAINIQNNTDAGAASKYGLYVGNISGGATANYAIYTKTGLNLFQDQVKIVPSSAATIGQIIQGFAAQLAPMLEIRESDGTIHNELNIPGATDPTNYFNKQGEDLDFIVGANGTATAFKIDAGAGQIEHYIATVMSANLTVNADIKGKNRAKQYFFAGF